MSNFNRWLWGGIGGGVVAIAVALLTSPLVDHFVFGKDSNSKPQAPVTVSPKITVQVGVPTASAPRDFTAAISGLWRIKQLPCRNGIRFFIADNVLVVRPVEGNVLRKYQIVRNDSNQLVVTSADGQTTYWLEDNRLHFSSQSSSGEFIRCE